MQSETDSDEPSESALVPSRPGQSRPPSSSPAHSELVEVSSPLLEDHDDHDDDVDEPQRPFRPFQAESSLIPTGIQLDRYTKDYTLHTDYLARYRPGAVSEGVFSQSHPFGTSHSSQPPSTVPPTGAIWTDVEKNNLFGSLARRSRHRPDLISLDLGRTKSESEVAWFLDSLRILSEYESAKRPDRKTREKSTWRDGEAPAAREVGRGWLEREEYLSRELVGAETTSKADTKEEGRQADLMRKTRGLRRLPTFKEEEGEGSLLVKTALRKADYEEKVARGEEILKEELHEDVQDFMGRLTGRRLSHLSALLVLETDPDSPDSGLLERPGMVDEEGCISVETMQALQEVWAADEARLARLESIGREGWTVQELQEAVALQRKVKKRKREIKEFDAWVKAMEVTETQVATNEVEEQAMVGTGVELASNAEQEAGDVSVEQEGSTRGKKRKRRQRKPRVKGPAEKKHKVENTTSSGSTGAVGGSPAAMTGVKQEQRNGIRRRDYLFTRKQAQPLFIQLYDDIHKSAISQREARFEEIARIDAYNPNRWAERSKHRSPEILPKAAERLKEKKLDLFNLDRLAPKSGNYEGSAVDSVSASLLELLYAHLDVLLHRLLMRVIYVGEGFAAGRPDVEDDVRLAVNAQMVYAAMDQIGLSGMIPPMENKSRHLEPFPVRHLLPTLPVGEDLEGSVRWAEDVVPNVARGIIDPSYGRVIVSNGSGHIDGEDDRGLETGSDDEADDEIAQKVEEIHDRLDTLRDQEHEDHLSARYNTDQRGLSEVPVFGERFDWSVYEADMGYITRLRRNWKVDEGTLRNSSGRKAKTGADDEDEAENGVVGDAVVQAEAEFTSEDVYANGGKDGSDPSEGQAFDHARAVEIAQLEKGKSS